MTNAELIHAIRNEIERLKDENRKIKCPANERYCSGYDDAFYDLVPFLDTLESEKPEPYNPVYDEAYLNEKIKKATESWKGVDVDAMLAECRGYDEEKSEKPMQDELEKAVVDYFEGYWPGMDTAEQCNTDLRFTPPAIMRLARHFAHWGAEHLKR